MLAAAGAMSHAHWHGCAPSFSSPDSPLSPELDPSTPPAAGPIGLLDEPPDHVLTGQELEAWARSVESLLATEPAPTLSARSWSLPIPDGAYSQVIAVDRDSWLRAIDLHLGSDEGSAWLRRRRVGRATARRVAAADAQAADWRTGRSLRTSHRTCAARAGTDEDTVRKIRRELTRTGYLVAVMQGRHLTGDERREARAIHGRHQVAVASVRALTLPRAVASTIAGLVRGCRAGKRSTPLPRRGQFSSSSRSLELTNARAARARGAHRTQRTTESERTRSITAWREAQKLIDRLPWLGRCGHRGRLVDVIAPFVARGWSSADLIEAIDADNRRAGRSAIPAGAQKSPIGLFLTQIRRACEGTPPSTLRRAQYAQDHAAASRRRAEHAQDVTQAVPMPLEVREIIAQLRRP